MDGIWRVLLLAAAFVPACDKAPPDEVVDNGPFVPPAPTMRRLTQAQYTNSVHDALGDGILISGSMEPDTALADFLVVGAGATSISPRGVEQYENLAFDIAKQLYGSDAGRKTVPCAPAGADDAGCGRKALAALGLKLWRRPLTDEELSELSGVVSTAGAALGDFYQGLQFGLAALLQSPNFLFRSELGQPDGAAGAPGTARYTGYEMASRLSFYLWNGPPDDALLAAAQRGALDTKAGVATEVDRLMASPKSRRGLDDFVTEWLQLYQLDDLVKDPKIFTQISPDVGPSARQETLLGAEHLAFDLDGDFRDIFTTRNTFVNHKLASIYNVRAPAGTGFGPVTLRSSQPRRGLLGQLSILALYSHPTTSSPTLRGKFVRTILLCQGVPPPPVNLNTALPPVSVTAVTMRQRLVAHAQDAFCAGCHSRMDPIGLGFENFDGLGVYRTTEAHVDIDASGDLDGKSFKDLGDLAQLVHDHPAASSCFTQRMYRYATGHAEQAGEAGEIQRLAKVYSSSGYRLQKLMIAIATSDAFGRAGVPGGQ